MGLTSSSTGSKLLKHNSNKCKSAPPVCVFKNSEFGDLEIVQDGDKFWFPATKCAIILGYQNPERAVRTHCKGVTEMALLTKCHQP